MILVPVVRIQVLVVVRPGAVTGGGVRWRAVLPPTFSTARRVNGIGRMWLIAQGQEAENRLLRNELEAGFRELVVNGDRQMGTRADCGRTLVLSYGHLDVLLVGNKGACWSTNHRKRWQRFRISSMARTGLRPNPSHKPALDAGLPFHLPKRSA